MRRVIPAEDEDGISTPTYPVPAGPNVHPKQIDWDKVASDIFDSLDYWNEPTSNQISKQDDQKETHG
jgi:hypothetical protein